VRLAATDESSFVRRLRRLFAIIWIGSGLALGGASSHPACAQSAGGWVEQPNVRLRLVPVGDVDGRARGALVELKLAHGWKTYWRMPGDAGIPPSFDWSGSTNAGEVMVYYPAPIAMADQGGVAVGYKDAVAFPVDVKPLDGSKPVDLTVELSIGVCKDICIPVEAKLKTRLMGGSGGAEAVVAHAAAMARVPVAVSMADAARRTPGLLGAQAVLAGDAPKLTFRTRAAGEVFIEAPDALFVPLARRLAGEGAGEAIYEVDLTKTSDVKELAGKTLRLTLVPAAEAPGARAIETTWTLP
jgi:DsbC/DsbD-like thiol-disulfide interchange protein